MQTIVSLEELMNKSNIRKRQQCDRRATIVIHYPDSLHPKHIQHTKEMQQMD